MRWGIRTYVRNKMEASVELLACHPGGDAIYRHVVDEAPAEAKGATSRSSKCRQRQKIGILRIHEAQAAADAAEAAAWASLMEEAKEAGALQWEPVQADSGREDYLRVMDDDWDSNI